MRNVWITIVLLLSTLAASAQCANMSVNVSETEICAPGIIKYQLQGAPTGSSFIWNVGKGQVPGTDTFYGFYDKAITIDVSVVVNLPGGGKCTVNKFNAAVIRSVPEPQITASRLKLCNGPDTVLLSTNTPDLKKISWIVDGINYFDHGSSVVHYFQSSGKKDVYLVVEDSFGCRASLDNSDLIEVFNAIEVDFSADVRSGCVPQKVNYTPEITLNGETVSQMSWTFDGADLTNYIGENPPQLIYYTAGNYSAGLKVTTTNGCVFEEMRPDFVGYGRNFKPVLELSRTHLCSGEEITIAAKPQMPGNYDFDLDGAELSGSVSNNTITAIYSDSGWYSIALDHEYNGCRSTAELIDTILVDFVKAGFNVANRIHCKSPHTVYLEQRSYTSNPVLSYEWTISENGTGNSVFESDNPSDSFTTSWGIFDLQLTVTNANGCKATFKKRGYIKVDSIRPDFIAEPRIACIGQDINFKSKTDKSSYMSSDTFRWEWFDTDDRTVIGTAKGAKSTFSYNALGKYDVKLYAGNGIGCIDTIRLSDYIEIVAPDLDFNIVDSVLCEGELIKLSANSTPEEADFLHEWFIVPNSANGSEIKKSGGKVNFKISEPGEYDIIYKASIDGGCVDSVVRDRVLKINGVRVEIDLDSVNGCDNFVTEASAALIYDLHASYPGTGLSYRWFSDFGTEVIFDKPNASATRITFTGPGIYQVKLEVTNSAGCSYITTSEDVVVGVKAEFSADKDILCVNDVAGLIQLSSLRPSDLRWEVIPSGFNLNLVQDDDNNVQIQPAQPGVFTIRLIADKYGVCNDTFDKEFNSLKVISSFETVDSQLYCAPAYAQFAATSTGADSFFWDFGDGTVISTTNKNVANIYTRNSGWKNGYDVTLISKSSYGCSDTVTVTDKVKVVGPVPDFELLTNEGCSPLEVKFVNKSTNIKYYYLNYGDGSSLDSLNFGPHTYRTFSSADKDVFIPSLYAVDSLGCVEILEASRPVTVYRSPALNVQLSDSTGCVPFKLEFRELNEEGSAYNWYLNASLISDNTIGAKMISMDGVSDLRLEVSNDIGCTSIYEKEVIGFARPDVEIIFDNTLCLNQTIQMGVNDRANTSLVRFDWVFGDETTMFDTSTAETPAWTYSSTGIKMINVNVENSNGCSASAIRNITLNDENSIEKGKIDFVSFTPEGNIEVQWKALTSMRIISSHLYRDDKTDPIGLSYGKGTELFHDNLTTTALHCYHASYIDVCDLEGDPQSVHCPVWLTVDNTEPFVNTLTWTAYMGWGDVDVYEIYRSSGNGFKRIAALNSDVLTYRDEKLCRGEYTYYILAYKAKLVSRSNTVAKEALYIKNRIPSDIRLVTVNNENSTVEINWRSSGNPALEKFILRKRDPVDNANVLSELELSGTHYTDYNVDIDNRSYLYEVLEVDHCGVETPVGLPGTSILLGGTYAGSASVLNWTPYLKWEEGVEKYIIQFRGNAGFTDLAVVDGNNTSYIDADYHPEVHDSYCYRVLAVSAGIVKDTSMSNITCTVGESLVHVPNAFTPNGNNLNETFKPVAHFVKDWNDNTFRDYTFNIYNRWGQLVFQTSNLDEGWDGTYMGKEAPAGVYMYMLNIMGVEGTLHRKQGEVLLYR